MASLSAWRPFSRPSLLALTMVCCVMEATQDFYGISFCLATLFTPFSLSPYNGLLCNGGNIPFRFCDLLTVSLDLSSIVLDLLQRGSGNSRRERMAQSRSLTKICTFIAWTNRRIAWMWIKPCKFRIAFPQALTLFVFLPHQGILMAANMVLHSKGLDPLLFCLCLE